MEDTEIPEKDIFLVVEQKLGSSDLNILAHSLDPVEEKIGLLGDHAFLNVTVFNNAFDKEQNLSFFVKLFPKSEALAAFAHGAGAFQREEFTYEMFSKFKQKGIDIIEQCTSHCYIARPNKYVILDNLALQGYEMSDKMEYLTYDSLLIVLHSLAKLHAGTLIFEETMSQETKKDFRILNGNEEILKESLYSDSKEFTNKDTIEAQFKCILTEIKLFKFPEKLSSGKEFLEATKELYPKIYQLVKPSNKYRNVLCHGDLWASNFMLKADSAGKTVSCKIVDFQSVRYVPPAHDVLQVIYLATSREFRQKYMYEVIGIYYSYLEKLLKIAGFNINKIIPFSEFMESCEEQKVFAALFVVGILPLILGDRSKIEQYFSDNDLYQKVFRDDRSDLVFDNQDNETYMKRLKESVEDLRDECEKFTL